MTMADAPEPVIRCLLPSYEDKHYQWLIWQYLERSGFNHTLSAFTLELNLKGINAGEFSRINKEDLQRHFACLLTKQLIGPSAAVPVSSGKVLQLSAGAAAAPNATAIAGNPLQLTISDPLEQDRNGCHSQQQHQQGIAGDTSPKDSLPADVRQQQLFDDQPEHARAHVRPHLQHKHQVHRASKVAHRPPTSAADKQEQHQQQQHMARNEQPDVEKQQRLRRRSSVSDQHSQLQHHQHQVPAMPSAAAAATVGHAPSAAAGGASTAPATPAATFADAAASPPRALEPKKTAAVEQPRRVSADAGAVAAQGTSQAAVAALVTGQATADSVAVEVDDVLDFGEEEDEAAAAAAADQAATAPTDGPAADVEYAVEEQQQQEREEEEEHLLSGVTEMSSQDDARHRQDDQAAAPVHKAMPAAKPLARGEPKQPLRAGKVPVPYPPAPAQRHHASRPSSTSRSRSKSRARSRSHNRGRSSTSRSKSRGRGRRRTRHHSSSRSRSRGRRGSSSSTRSKTHSPVSKRRSSSRGHSYSRSRSCGSRSRSRDRRSASKDRSKRSRSRNSRSRSGTRSRSPGRDAAGSRRNSYQGSWQRKASGDLNSQQGQQLQQWQRGGWKGGAVYTNYRARGRGGYTNSNNRNSDWGSDKGEKDFGNQTRGEGPVQGGRGRGGRGTYGQLRDGRGYPKGGNRPYSGQYGQYSGHGRGDLQQHDGEDKDRCNNLEQQQQQAAGEEIQAEQQQHAGGISPSQGGDNAAEEAVHGVETVRPHRGGRTGRGRGRGRAAGGNGGGVSAAFTFPGQEGAVTEGVTAPRVLGREGGKYDWPPRDADGNILQTSASGPELTAAEPHQQAPVPRAERTLSRPMIQNSSATAANGAEHWHGEAAAAPTGVAAAGCVTQSAGASGSAAAPPPRPSVFQRLGGLPGQAISLPNDRWQLRDDGLTGANSAPCPRTVNKSTSPKGPSAGAGAGHAAAAKRKLGPSITDLSMDSSAGGASPASTAAGDAAPAKRARGGSPA